MSRFFSRALLLSLVFPLVTWGEDFNRWPERVYVDPDLDFATITKDPGKTWQDCQTDKSQCVAWPDGKSEIYRVTGVGPVERKEINPATGEVEAIPYVKVRYKYSREFTKKDGTKGTLDQIGEGWIDSRILRKEKLRPLYKAEPKPMSEAAGDQRIPPPPKPKPQPPCPPQTQAQRNLGDIKDLAKFMEKSPQEQVNAVSEALDPYVGQCSLEPPTKKRLDKWNRKNIYDVEVMPGLKAVKAKLPSIPKQTREGGPIETASFQDIVAIDALARTIYSEMNECFKSGTQFPMAAAKVALNRSQLVETGKAPSHFIGSPNSKEKPTVARVVTAPYQFSVWNEAGAKNPRDKTILMSLCPTKDANSKKNWKGTKPIPWDVSAWKLALKVASEAVLFPERFSRKTKDITQFYYTSKMENYDGRSRPQPPPLIEGRPVESFQCMYVWNGK